MPDTLDKDLKLFRYHSDLALFSLSGSQNKSLIQSLITSDLKDFEQNPRKAAISTLMLNSKGKIICPLNVIRPASIVSKQVVLDDDFMIIQVPKKLSDVFRGHMMYNSSNKKVNMEDITSNFDQFASYVR